MIRLDRNLSKIRSIADVLGLEEIIHDTSILMFDMDSRAKRFGKYTEEFIKAAYDIAAWPYGKNADLNDIYITYDVLLDNVYAFSTRKNMSFATKKLIPNLRKLLKQQVKNHSKIYGVKY